MDSSALITGALAILIIGTAMALYALGRTVPEALSNFASLVVGFYFGSRVGKPPAAEPVAPPALPPPGMAMRPPRAPRRPPSDDAMPIPRANVLRAARDVPPEERD